MFRKRPPAAKKVVPIATTKSDTGAKSASHANKKQSACRIIRGPKTTGLSARGYWVMKADLADGEEEALKRECTMAPAQDPGSVAAALGAPPVEFPLWRETATRLYLPKYFGLSRFGAAAAERSTIDPGTLIEPPLRFAGSLRDEQRKPIEAFLEAARDPARMGGILSLPCGFGKTVAALYLVATLGVRAMVVVHKDFLLNQWKERIADFLPDAKIGLVKAKTVDVAGKDVVIASLQSLSMKQYDEGLFAGIGFLIIDECHRVGTEVFSRALHKTNFRYSLGISATVNRKDGMTKAFVAFLGDVLYRGARREDSVVVVQHRFWDEAPEYRREVTIGAIGKPNVSRMINNIAEFAPRIHAVADAIGEMLRREPARKVLVLSDRKQQLTDVRAALAERHGIDSGFYWGGMKRPALAETEAKQVMLATFSYAAEGMDVPGLDTLVLASPKSDIEQSVGRILRLKAADRLVTPLVYDFVDQFSLFERQGMKRAAFYKRFKYPIFRDLDRAAEALSPNKTRRKTRGSGGDDDDDGSEGDDLAAPSSSSAAAFAFIDDEEC
jgi:hypothetical protein